MRAVCGRGNMKLFLGLLVVVTASAAVAKKANPNDQLWQGVGQSSVDNARARDSYGGMPQLFDRGPTQTYYFPRVRLGQPRFPEPVPEPNFSFPLTALDRADYPPPQQLSGPRYSFPPIKSGYSGYLPPPPPLSRLPQSYIPQIGATFIYPPPTAKLTHFIPTAASPPAYPLSITGDSYMSPLTPLFRPTVQRNYPIVMQQEEPQIITRTITREIPMPYFVPIAVERQVPYPVKMVMTVDASLTKKASSTDYFKQRLLDTTAPEKQSGKSSVLVKRQTYNGMPPAQTNQFGSSGGSFPSDNQFPPSPDQGGQSFPQQSSGQSFSYSPLLGSEQGFNFPPSRPEGPFSFLPSSPSESGYAFQPQLSTGGNSYPFPPLTQGQGLAYSQPSGPGFSFQPSSSGPGSNYPSSGPRFEFAPPSSGYSNFLNSS